MGGGTAGADRPPLGSVCLAWSMPYVFLGDYISIVSEIGDGWNLGPHTMGDLEIEWVQPGNHSLQEMLQGAMLENGKLLLNTLRVLGWVLTSLGIGLGIGPRAISERGVLLHGSRLCRLRRRDVALISVLLGGTVSLLLPALLWFVEAPLPSTALLMASVGLLGMCKAVVRRMAERPVVPTPVTMPLSRTASDAAAAAALDALERRDTERLNAGESIEI
eukprot:NODE_3930_length_727_cov_385.327381.p1 GENE.NODE_3930_length_727_cov_385.327381~~NODE_3930_length_727_cov_385.327381.p1  ORF type:complete len:219 (+),score=38.89 NODE_3930_length_727_cov_385.327381:3-659(+)